MSCKTFYAVACGKNPGVYYTWEECRKEVEGFPSALFRKFPREKDAWDFVKSSCRDMKLSAGISPVKRKLDSECSNLNQTMKLKLLERLQKIEVKIQEFHENVTKDIISIKEEFLSENPPPAKKTLLIDVEDAPCPKEYTNKRPTISHLPSTSKKFFGDATENVPEDDQVSTFRVDSDGYVEVYTDGACSNNGFKGAKAGVGVWFGDGHSLNISEPVRGRITNNCAEIEAATLAIEAASLAGIKKLKLYTDSTFLISAITSWIKKWKKNNWKTANGEAVKNKEELILLDQARQGIDVVFVHVKGHAGNYENEQADALARAGAEKCVPSHKG